jgi:serine/threonine protein kinase
MSYSTPVLALGEGTYSRVHKAVHVATSESVAIKRPRTLDAKRGVGIQAYREVALLRELSHPNVVSLRDAFLDGDGDIRNVSIALPLQSSDLAQRTRALREKGATFDGRALSSIARQLLDGVAYLHSKWVMHRDLKPSNVLLSGDHATIADFGMARSFRAPLRPLSDDGTVATLWYRAPELLLGAKEYCVAIDNWALGCIIGEMSRATPNPIFSGTEAKRGELEADQARSVFRVLGLPSPSAWPDVVRLVHWPKVQQWDAADYPAGDTLAHALWPTRTPTAEEEQLLGLLRGLLHFEPGTRLTAKAALQHAWTRQQNS